MAQQVLVVENEEIVALDLEVCLATMGYHVSVATTGEEAVVTANRLRPDVVLMDINLDGSMDGIGAAECIRRETGIPLIFLTAYAGMDTIDRAISVDPVGYIVKPFNEKSLAANIRIALHRGRMENMGSNHSRFPNMSAITLGNLKIDRAGHRVLHSGNTKIDLTRKEFRILECLSEHVGIPLSPEALLTKAWGPQFVHYTKALRVHIGHLRQKVERVPNTGVLIETVRGVGYRLVEVGGNTGKTL